jgi:hypothetical protein
MSDPAQIITVTLGFKTFQACRFCAAHLEDTIARLGKRFPNAQLIVIQPPWNDGVTASAGTHDKCACFDVQIVGFSWIAAQNFLRSNGWAAWYRPAIAGLWGDHIHMVSLGCTAPRGALVPGQVADYYARLDGLKGHAPDPTWHPADIGRTIFDFAQWEANMPLNTDDLAAVKLLVDKAVAEAIPSIVNAILKAPVDDNPAVNVKTALRQLAASLRKAK